MMLLKCTHYCRSKRLLIEEMSIEASGKDDYPAGGAEQTQEPRAGAPLRLALPPVSSDCL
jgi:hypothetical protein